MELLDEFIIILTCFFSSLLATELLTIFKIYPGLVLEYSEELIEFVQAMKCLDDGFEQFFTNVVIYSSLRTRHYCRRHEGKQEHNKVARCIHESTIACLYCRFG